MTDRNPTSAADIIVPSRRPPRTPHPLFDGLRELLDDCGASVRSHDRIAVAVSACIDRGVDRRTNILGVLGHLGLNRIQVAKVLDQYAGDDVYRYRWRLAADGRYVNLSEDRSIVEDCP